MSKYKETQDEKLERYRINHILIKCHCFYKAKHLNKDISFASFLTFFQPALTRDRDVSFAKAYYNNMNSDLKVLTEFDKVEIESELGMEFLEARNFKYENSNITSKAGYVSFSHTSNEISKNKEFILNRFKFERQSAVLSKNNGCVESYLITKF